MKYRVRWSIEGTSYIEANSPEDAEDIFTDLTLEELNRDSIDMDIYDIEEWDDQTVVV